MVRLLNGDGGGPGAAGGAGADLEGLKVLVVDDEPAVGRAIAHAAEACGCHAGYAISAEAFRAQYRSEAPDIVLLDLSLPGADGVELLRFLAGEGSNASILIVSGFDERVVEAAVRLGAAMGLNMGPPLAKPLTVRQLGQALAAAPTVAAQVEEDRHALCL